MLSLPDQKPDDPQKVRLSDKFKIDMDFVQSKLIPVCRDASPQDPAATRLPRQPWPEEQRMSADFRRPKSMAKDFETMYTEAKA